MSTTNLVYSDTIPTVPGWYWRREQQREQIMHLGGDVGFPRHWRTLREACIATAIDEQVTALRALPPQL